MFVSNKSTTQLVNLLLQELLITLIISDMYAHSDMYTYSNKYNGVFKYIYINI